MSIFGTLDNTISWDMLEMTKERSTNQDYHKLVDDLLTNDEIMNDEVYVISQYIFASLEDFEYSNENSHLTIELVRELYNQVSYKLEQLQTEKQEAEKIASSIVLLFSVEDNQEQSVQSFIWDSEEDSPQYIQYLELVDLVDSSVNHNQLINLVNQYIPSFNY